MALIFNTLLKTQHLAREPQVKGMKTKKLGNNQRTKNLSIKIITRFI